MRSSDPCTASAESTSARCAGGVSVATCAEMVVTRLPPPKPLSIDEGTSHQKPWAKPRSPQPNAQQPELTMMV